MVVPGRPMAKARPTPFAPRTRRFVPSQKHQEALAYAFMSNRGAFPEGEVRVEIEFHVFGVQPDGDNAEKLVLDALQDAGVVGNDRQVKDCHWALFRAAKDQQRTVVRVAPR